MSILSTDWITRGILSQQRERLFSIINIYFTIIQSGMHRWLQTEGNYNKLIKGPTIEGKMLKRRK